MPSLRTIALVLLALVSLAAAEGERQTVRLLAIGNSFSNNVLGQLPALARAGGRSLVFEHRMFGGASLAQHWARVEAADRDPADPRGGYDGKGTLRAALVMQPWDVVTIQQYSLISHDPATYRPYADRLVALIRELAPQAGILMHQTWAYRSDDPRFADATQAGAVPGMRSSAEMHRQVAAAYRNVAQALGLGLLPVGEAFARVEADPLWGFAADPAWQPAAAVAPALPDQRRSLHVGWWWKRQDGKPPELAYDGHHASSAGEYLGACVWYEVLFRASPVGNPYRPQGMPEDQARFLQETAHQVVAAEAAGH